MFLLLNRSDDLSIKWLGFEPWAGTLIVWYALALELLSQCHSTTQVFINMQMAQSHVTTKCHA